MSNPQPYRSDENESEIAVGGVGLPTAAQDDKA
jgi:hypothetical protein